MQFAGVAQVNVLKINVKCAVRKLHDVDRQRHRYYTAGDDHYHKQAEKCRSDNAEYMTYSAYSLILLFLLFFHLCLSTGRKLFFKLCIGIKILSVIFAHIYVLLRCVVHFIIAVSGKVMFSVTEYTTL